MALHELLIANHAQVSEFCLVLGVVLVLGLESFWPRQAASSRTLWRWVNNLLLAGLSYLLVAIALNTLMRWWFPLMGARVGLLPRADLGPWAEFAVVLLCLELFNYWVHRASHALPLLWRLHAVHHSDTEFDATTAHRHHPLEGMVSGLLSLPLLWLLSPGVEVLLAYVVTRALAEAMTHGNLTWGSKANRCLKWLLVTPDFHRVHHCATLPYTDRNFSSLLPVFDHLFGTAADPLDVRHQGLPMGLDYFRESSDARLDQLLLQPFRRKA